MACALHCIIRKTHVSTDELIKMFKEGRTVPRKGHTQKRDVLADPLYNSKVVTKLINNIMLDGKKGPPAAARPLGRLGRQPSLSALACCRG